MLKTLRIATRKSPLALAQAEIVRQALLECFPALHAELVPMSTTGDENTGRSLAEIGGKGLFTKELEEGLLNGHLDIAVHSLKDMETRLTPGLTIAAVLKREDPRDALIAPAARTIAGLPEGASVGTSSLRRAAQLKIMRPDLVIVPFRGNVATRLKKLEANEAQAGMLALAGLKRLGLEQSATEILDAKHFIPAVGQGIIAVECLESNDTVRAMLASVNHEETFISATAERSMLAVLDGSCRTPIAGYARCEGKIIHMDALVADKEGTHCVRASRSGASADAAALGESVAHELLAKGGRQCLSH